jgi:hypothetical protein
MGLYPEPYFPRSGPDFFGFRKKLSAGFTMGVTFSYFFLNFFRLGSPEIRLGVQPHAYFGRITKIGGIRPPVGLFYRR